MTPIFLHFGLIHLLFNMVFLYQLGGMIEARRGPWRYLLLGLVCAVLSNIAQYGLSTIGWEDGRFVVQMPGLFGGMSGVLYGLFGYIWMKSRYEPALGLRSAGPRHLDDRLAVRVHDRGDRLGRQLRPRGRPDRRRGHRGRAALVAASARRTAHVSMAAASTGQKK